MTAPTSEAQTQGDTAVDGADPQDAAVTEAALAVVVGAIILSWLLPGPSSLLPDVSEAWKQQLAAAVSGTIRSYVQRSAADLAYASGRPDAAVAAAEAGAEVYPQVMSAIERWSDDTLKHLTERDVPESELSARASTAAQNLARMVAGYAQSAAREATVDRLGAVWSIWKSRHDDRVRSTHRGLDGNKVPFGGAFVTEAGNIIRFPGDPEAPIEEVAGCRCHLVYRLQPKGSSLAEV